MQMALFYPSINSEVNMQVNPFNIEITENRFSIQETIPQNAEPALITLIKIEHVLQNLKHLNYDAGHPDDFSNLPKEKLYEVLREKAKDIRDNYIQEQSQRNRIGRLFFSDEGPINDVFARIENSDTKLLGLGAPIFPALNQDTTLKVLEKLKGAEATLSNLSQVSHRANKMTQKFILAEIQELGYEGNDYDEAIRYREQLKNDIENCDLFGFIPSTVKIQSVKQMDLILEKLKNMSNNQFVNACRCPLLYSNFNVRTQELIPVRANLRKFLSLNFNPKGSLAEIPILVQAGAICVAASFGDAIILELLLKMGVAPDLVYINRTPLECAKEGISCAKAGEVNIKAESYEKCVEILTEALANKEKLANKK